jgi:hypothetical protein
MCWDGNSGSWHEWGKTGRRRRFGYFGGGELETNDLGSGMGVHSSVCPHLYGFRSTGVGVLLTDGGRVDRTFVHTTSPRVGLGPS